MCGIAGIVFKEKASSELREKFRAAADLSKHRGPDHTGTYTDDRIELIHHRLSILDVNERSNQPFVQEQPTTSVLIYNGEIYNYRELSKEYQLTLKTSSDTEVLFKLLHKDDLDLQVLNGIFAFAFYEEGANRLTLVRDRLGVKPLYYYEDESYFLFASEAKVIYRFLDHLSLNYDALVEYLSFGNSVSEHTIIDGVKKVKPGATLTFDLVTGTSTLKQYWSVKKDITPRPHQPGFATALTETKRLLAAAVERQCISDVQVGAYLSGGIDSSAVVALASGYTDKKLNTYSVAFDKNPHSELQQAEKIAKQYGTNHYEFEVNTQGLDEYFGDLIFQYDEPFADPAMIPLHLMAAKASDFSRVVLQGDGGDEVFAGYGRYVDLDNLPSRKLIFGMLGRLHPQATKRQYYQSRHASMSGETAAVMAVLVHGELNNDWQSAINLPLVSRLNSQRRTEIYREKNKAFQALPLAQRMLYIDLELMLPEIYLEKVDKVNMFHSIEARVPLLDNDLADYVMRLPFGYKVRKNTTKYLLRKALEDLIPAEILYHQKRSFGTPVNEWLRTTLYAYAQDVFERGAKANLPFDFVLLKHQLEHHKQRIGQVNVRLVWRFLILTLWLLMYQDKLELELN